MRILFLVSTFLLASCGTMDPEINPNKFTSANGKTAYSMLCSGIGQTLDACYTTADKLCPAGYNVLELTTLAIGDNPRQSLSIECK
jgi:hypothetical protein